MLNIETDVKTKIRLSGRQNVNKLYSIPAKPCLKELEKLLSTYWFRCYAKTWFVSPKFTEYITVGILILSHKPWFTNILRKSKQWLCMMYHRIKPLLILTSQNLR